MCCQLNFSLLPIDVGSLARLPVKGRGMGLRSQVETILAAFIGSLEMSLPFLCGEEAS